ncbi:MAG: recombinase [Marinilabiliales bacterium]|nr:MAG: recombinase [Marinilabiliales bacterium]
MLNLMFFIRKSKLLKSGEASVNLRITVSGKSVEVAIGKNVNPDSWSNEKGGVIGNNKEAKVLNTYIDQVKADFLDFYRQFSYEGKDITAQTLKNAWLGVEEDHKMILQIFQEHNDQVKLLIGKDFAQATHQRYETSLKHVKAFIKKKYKVNDLPVQALDHNFATGLEFFLKTERDCGHNTAAKYIKNFKKVVRIAMANGWIKSDPFANHKMPLRKVDRGFLSEAELELLRNKEIPVERLNYVRDAFLFACYTGLAYADLKKLSKRNLIEGQNGVLWIHTKRTKTDNECHIPLISAAQDILTKYSNHPHCIEKNVLLPVYSNQKTNAYLKEIALLCGIDKNLTSHLARHTFATTITLNNNVPIESVSKMLGHSSINMTKIYARLLDNKVENDMSALMNKY